MYVDGTANGGGIDLGSNEFNPAMPTITQPTCLVWAALPKVHAALYDQKLHNYYGNMCTGLTNPIVPPPPPPASATEVVTKVAIGVKHGARQGPFTGVGLSAKYGGMKTLTGYCPHCAFGGDPVNMATGNYLDSTVDLPSPYFGMSWGRWYNSLDNETTNAPDDGSTTGPLPRVPLQRGWSTSYSSHLALIPVDGLVWQVPAPVSGDISFIDSTGRLFLFRTSVDGGFVRAANLRADLVAVAGAPLRQRRGVAV